MNLLSIYLFPAGVPPLNDILPYFSFKAIGGLLSCPCRVIGYGHPKVMNYRNCVELESLMLYVMFNYTLTKKRTNDPVNAHLRYTKYSILSNMYNYLKFLPFCKCSPFKRICDLSGPCCKVGQGQTLYKLCRASFTMFHAKFLIRDLLVMATILFMLPRPFIQIFIPPS